jgi:hypothetical protein
MQVHSAPPAPAPIIVLCGKQRHGKTTLLKMLKLHYGMVPVSFAEPLKWACRDIFGFSNDQLYGEAKQHVDAFWGVTPREVLQVVGTQLFRERLPEILPELKDIWVRTALRHLSQHSSVRNVVEDCRFRSEYNALRRFGVEHSRKVIVIRVVRPGCEADPKFANHPSETDLDDLDTYPPDFILVNDGTMDTLEHKLHGIMRKCNIDGTVCHE